MIISDTEKFVFIHNPKVGGMSFRTVLGQYDTRENFFFEWKMVGNEGRQIDMAHITPFQFRRFYPKIFEEMADYYKFGFVRNPYNRYLSAVSQHLKLCTHYVRKALLQQPELFYRIACNLAEHTLDVHAIEQDHRLVHFRRQMNFFHIDRKMWADAIFKLEDTAQIAEPKITKWIGEALLTPKNQTREYSENGYDLTQLDKRTIARINEFYAGDFERFSYDKID